MLRRKRLKSAQQKGLTFYLFQVGGSITAASLTWFPLPGVKFRSGSHFFLSFAVTAPSQGTQIKRVSQSSSTGDLILMWLAIT